MAEERRAKFCEVHDKYHRIWIQYDYSGVCEYVSVYEKTSGKEILHGTYGMNIHEETSGYSAESNDIKVLADYVKHVVRETIKWLECWEVDMKNR